VRTGLDDPGLTVALALLAGLTAQVLARAAQVPAIVALLAAGVVLGPDGLNLVRPEAIGAALPTIVSFGVAVILFEGTLCLNVRRLRHEATVVRRLVLVGAAVTGVGAALAARLVMGWPWRLCLVFGALMTVTGPTVIQPLLRRVPVRPGLQTILEAEGILLDAVGAVLAVVALDVPLPEPVRGFGQGLRELAVPLAAGVALGGATGFVIVRLRRWRRVPMDLDNVATLVIVLGLFQISRALIPESGVPAVVTAAFVVANRDVPDLGGLMLFKEQLTVLLLSLLFVLLAADVRVATVADLGWRCLLLVALLMFAIRPLSVALSTLRSRLETRERLFLAWIAPRGIVAVAVSSLAAERLAAAGQSQAAQLRALVFLVVAVTVVVDGLTARPVSKLLGVARAGPCGYLILGANAVGRALGRALSRGGEEVVIIDVDPDALRAAQRDGLSVIYGNAFRSRTLHRARIEGRRACLAATAHSEANVLFARAVRDEHREMPVLVALAPDATGTDAALLADLRGALLFATPHRVERWTRWLEAGATACEPWRRTGAESAAGACFAAASEMRLLPLALDRPPLALPVDDAVVLRPGDVVTFALHAEEADEARAWLAANGWETAGVA
jgi:NhaP-type Na+/H+ or K+/H+ antiporter